MNVLGIHPCRESKAFLPVALATGLQGNRADAAKGFLVVTMRRSRVRVLPRQVLIAFAGHVRLRVLRFRPLVRSCALPSEVGQERPMALLVDARLFLRSSTSHRPLVPQID